MGSDATSESETTGVGGSSRSGTTTPHRAANDESTSARTAAVATSDDGVAGQRSFRKLVVSIAFKVADALDDAWSAAADKLDKTWLRSLIGALLVVTYTVIDSARRALDTGIRKINPIGEPGVGVNSLHEGADAIDGAFRIWTEGAVRLRPFFSHDPLVLAATQTWLELVLVPFSAAVLFGVSRHLRKSVREATEGRARAERTLLTAACLGTIAYLALGVFNQVAELIIIKRREPVRFIAPALVVTGAARVLVLVLVVIPLLIVVVRRSRVRSGERPWWRGAPTAYRSVLLVAALHAVMLLVSVPGKQVEDALRLWAARPWLGVCGLLATALLSVALALYATRIGSSVVQSRRVLGRTGTSVLVSIGIALLLIGFVARQMSIGIAALLLAVGTVVLAIGLLSLPIMSGGASIEGDPPVSPTDIAREVVPAALASSPFIVLSVALVRTLVPSYLDRSVTESARTDVWLLAWAIACAAIAVIAFPVTRQVAANEVTRRATHRRQRAAEVADEVGQANVEADALTGHAATTGRDGSFEGEGDAPTERTAGLASDNFRQYAIAVFVVASACAIWLGADPVANAPRFGVVAVMAIFLVVIASTIGAVAVMFDGSKLPAALDLVGFRKVPAFALLLVVGLLTHHLYGTDGYHDVDTIADTTRPASTQLTIESAFAAWSAEHAPPAEVDPDGPPPSVSRPGVPLVFVTAAGGGIKAAAFTATVLDCVFAPTGTAVVEPEPVDDADGDLADADGADDALPEPADTDRQCAEESRWDDVFVLSGASGGSVGIASVFAETSLATHPGNWVAERLGKDLLSPTVAWQLLVEAPNAVASFNPSRDRAEVLEATWREQFGLDGSLPFYVDRSSPGWNGPLAFYSGTNLNDGCRVNVSPVRAGVATPDVGASVPYGSTADGVCTARRVAPDGTPVVADQGDTYDLTDYLCHGGNIDLATAAFLSARFPYVSPTATAGCDDEVITVGDGGYRDNSGASTVAELWSVLEPLVDHHNRSQRSCIVPIWIEIGTGYAGLQGDRPATNAAQFIAPATGALSVFGDLSFGTVEQLAAEFTRPLAADLEARTDGEAITRHYRVSLVDHPGVTAPLGWSLSTAAVTDFEQQLQANENQRIIQALDRLLPGDGLTCDSV